MNSEPLQYYIHDGPRSLRFHLSGSLSGRGAESVQHAWQTALSILGDRPLIVDITSVVDADDRGHGLLALWQQSGARIVAGSRASRALAQYIVGELAVRGPARA